MAPKADKDLALCESCKKIIPRRPGVMLCQDCLARLGRSAGASGGASQLRFVKEAACRRCNRTAPVAESGYCMRCHIDVTADIGSATKALDAEAAQRQKRPDVGTQAVLRELEEKRKRAPTNRISLVGAKPLKYWIK